MRFELLATITSSLFAKMSTSTTNGVASKLRSPTESKVASSSVTSLMLCVAPDRGGCMTLILLPVTHFRNAAAIVAASGLASTGSADFQPTSSLKSIVTQFCCLCSSVVALLPQRWAMSDSVRPRIIRSPVTRTEPSARKLNSSSRSRFVLSSFNSAINCIPRTSLSNIWRSLFAVSVL